MRDWLGRRVGKAERVDVVVLVDVFDCVEVDVATIPLKRRFLSRSCPGLCPWPSIGPQPMKKRIRNTRFILLCYSIILDRCLHRSISPQSHQLDTIGVLTVQSLC